MSDRKEKRTTLTALLTASALTLGCPSARAPAPAPPEAAPAPEPCLLLPALDASRATIRVALTEHVSPRRAPLPANDSERLVFRQLYDRLIELRCDGGLAPGLARGWRLEPGGLTLTLDEDAVFWDGSPVTAASVLAAWRATAERVRLPVDPSAALAIDERTLRVALPGESGPEILAHPALAVARPSTQSAWPVGTGAYRVESRPGAAGGALGVALATTGDGPEIRLAAGSDPRDLLDSEVDFLATRDPLAIDYAADLPGYRSRPLPWDRTYVLLSPESSLELGHRAMEDLARDAVRGEAQAADGPSWWSGMTSCAPGLVAVTPPGGSPTEPRSRLVYPQTDRRAGELAERLVSILGARDPAAERLVARGLSPGEMATALRERGDAGYLLALARQPRDPCREGQALLERAPWLAERLARPPLTALVDTRVRAIAGERMSPVWIDGGGDPLFSPPPTGTPEDGPE